MAGLTAKQDLDEPTQSSSYIGYYFPVRYYRRNKTTEGAWLRSFKEEQRRRFKAILCKNYKTLDEIKSQVHGTRQKLQLEADDQMQDGEQERKLNGFFLLKHCYAEDPAEVFSIDINYQGFSHACSEDFLLFDRVQCINARENRLELEAFATFCHLHVLELSLNGMKSLEVKYGDFPHLQHLDLSFNNLPGNCLKSLGLMPNLLTLNLSGNGISELPTDFSKLFRLSTNLRYLRFPRLQILRLDNNKLCHPETFVSLGNLPHLEHLDLENNLLYHVPQLFNQDGRFILFEKLPHSFKEEEYSASDLNESNDLSEKENEDLTGRLERRVKDRSEPRKLSIGDTDAFLTSLLNDLDEDDDLLTDEFPTELLGRQSRSLDNTDQTSEKSVVPVTTSIETQDSQKTDSYQTKPVRFYDKTRPAFSHLISLNLANNRFSNEEALIEIATWPSIQALSIHGNPLIKNKKMKKMSLVKSILTQKLGISVISQRPCIPSHHHTEIYPRFLRNVKDRVRKLPKLTVDQILALESSKPDPTSSSGQSPIVRSEHSAFSRRSSHPCSGGYYDKEEIIDSERTAESFGQVAAEKEMAFFMTQPCDESVPKDNEKAIPKQKKYSIAQELLLQQYKEYEILFEEDDEEDEKNISFVQPTKDVQSNLQALRYALDHQCTVLDQTNDVRSVNVHDPTPTKHPPPAKIPEITYEQRVANVLEDLRQKSAVKEVPLSEVFSDPTTYKEDFKEAKKLLLEVESSYIQKSEDKKYLKDSAE